MATEFQVVEAASAAALKTSVETQLAAGWTVAGGVQIDRNPNFTADTYGQDAPVYSIAMEK